MNLWAVPAGSGMGCRAHGLENTRTSLDEYQTYSIS